LGLVAISALFAFELAEAKTDPVKQHERHRLLAQMGLIALALLAIFEIAAFVLELRLEALQGGRIVTVSATLDVEVMNSPRSGSGWRAGDQDYIAFLHDDHPVLVLRSTNVGWRNAPDSDVLKFTGAFDLSSPVAQVAGRLQDLAQAQAIQIGVSGIDKPVGGGSLRLLVNNAYLLDFQVNPQAPSKDGVLIVPIPGVTLAPLEEN
jgi:hypothetical protein